MRVVSAADVTQLLPVADAIPLMAHAFRLFSAGTGAYPLRTHVRLHNPSGDALVMPAYDGTDGLGVKLVTVHPHNPDHGYPAVRALYLLVRAGDGEPLMVCDGAALTAIRTGAASGVATQVLALPDARRGALFGAGAQAETQLLAMLAARPLESVAVVARRPAHARDFCRRLDAAVAARLEPAASPDEAVRDADIITTATSSCEPVFDGRLVKLGAHINAVGAYRADMRELDPYAMARARVYVDSREAALAEAGDLVMPLRDGTIDEAHVRGELGEVLLSRVRGRESAEDITVFKSVGLAVQDLIAAMEIYRRAQQHDVGTDVAL
jgi:ornithine cyclodeaminase